MVLKVDLDGSMLDAMVVAREAGISLERLLQAVARPGNDHVRADADR